MKTETLEQVGQIAVDSGMVIVSDPVYRRPDDWPGFVGAARGIYQIASSPNPWDHQAVVVGGFGGDGVYPVFIRRDEKSGIVTELVIQFRSPE